MDVYRSIHIHCGPPLGPIQRCAAARLRPTRGRGERPSELPTNQLTFRQLEVPVSTAGEEYALFFLHPQADDSYEHPARGSESSSLKADNSPPGSSAPEIKPTSRSDWAEESLL